MKKIGLIYDNLILFGQSDTEQAILYYKEILLNISETITKDVNLDYATTKILANKLASLSGKTLLFPLFLCNGILYQRFCQQIKLEINAIDITLPLPLSSYSKFYNTIFYGASSTCFLLHGSYQYDNHKQNELILKAGQQKKYQHFMFLTGEPHYQKIIEKAYETNKKILIRPLLLFRGNHLKEIFIYLQERYPKSSWELEPTLLEKPFIRKVISEIIAESLLNTQKDW